jgi:type VI secretion system protein ImpK
VEQSIGVFGQDVLLWVSLLLQTPQRPAVHDVHRQANWLLDELQRSAEAKTLPIQSVEDALFALCALIDEIAMSMPEMRPMWSQYMLQVTRHNTANAGVEVFERLVRVRKGPSSVVGTYQVVLAMGFQGCYGLPGADRYQLVRVRREIAIQLGIDPDADRLGGAIVPARREQVEVLDRFREVWYRRVGFGRALGGLLLASALIALIIQVAI